MRSINELFLDFETLEDSELGVDLRQDDFFLIEPLMNCPCRGGSPPSACS